MSEQQRLQDALKMSQMVVADIAAVCGLNNGSLDGSVAAAVRRVVADLSQSDERGDRWREAAKNAQAERDVARAERDRAAARFRTQKTKARRLRGRLRDHGLPTVIHDEEVTPPLPTPQGDDPEHWRFAAYLVDNRPDWRLRSEDRSVASILYEEADRVETERAARARHDELVVALADNGRLHPSDALELADLLVKRFDIAAKSGSV